MIPQLNETQMKILLSFYHFSFENRTVTKIARSLDMEKYEVSRQVVQLSDMGLINRDDVRHPDLTERGRKLAKKLAHRLETAENHLIYEGVPQNEARRDAVIWALNCSESTFETIKKWEQHYIIKGYFPKNAAFKGKELCEKIGNGKFVFPFVIYRDNIKDMSNISMANFGFRHPCECVVKDGKGIVILRMHEMAEKSMLTGEEVRGRVAHLKYFNGNEWIEIVFSGETIQLPLEHFTFLNIGDDIAGRILHGSICLKMSCTVGEAHMPESTAIFTLLIH